MIKMPEMVESMNTMNSFGQIKEQIAALRPYQIEFNKLSVEGVTILHRTDDINSSIDEILKQIAEYGNWKESALKLADDPEQGFDAARLVCKSIQVANESARVSFLHDEDPRHLLHLDRINDDIIKKYISIWMVLTSVPDGMLSGYTNTLARLLDNIVVVLNKVSTIFGVNRTIKPFVFLGYTIGEDDNRVKFELHDHVVAFSEKELEEQRRLEREAEEERIRQDNLRKLKESIREHASVVLKCYNELRSQNVLEKLSLTDKAIQQLNDPTEHWDCQTAKALFEFLVEMSNTERCMPGEDMPNDQRIKGSLMDLETRVLTDKTAFMLYGAKHNDVVLALPCFDDKNGKIVAQYVSSKDYVDKLIDEPERCNGTINVFVMN